MPLFDVLIIGAGAAGMMCAAQLGQHGLRVLLIDHNEKIGEKIRISGGGRCNFTNLNLSHGNPSTYYISQQPHFVRHALAHYGPFEWMALLDQYQVDYHEKHHGQMFCTHSAQDIIHVLQAECAKGQVQWQKSCIINQLDSSLSGSHPIALHSNKGIWRGRTLVIATGALAAPAVGASALGYELAKQLGHQIIPPEAALVPLRFEHWQHDGLDTLSGIALPVLIRTQNGKKTIEFSEDLLFRHKGLSGPAILQISSYWQKGQLIEIDLCPHLSLANLLCEEKKGKKIQLDTALSQLANHLPKRLIDYWLKQTPFAPFAKHPWADTPNHILKSLANSLHHWQLLPSGHDGHKKAEATRGGIATCQLNPKTMGSTLHQHIYFIGEVVDVTGWLGGYNFQWAWSSAVCAARAIIAQSQNN